MLPSLGYFKDIKCPYTNDGHCDRPYCHFKHAKKDQTAESDYSSTASYAAESVLKLFQKCKEVNPTQKHTFTTELLQMFCDFEKKHQEKITLQTQSQQLSDITYNPTPISKLSEHSKTRHIPIPYTPQRPHISLLPLNANKSKLEYSPGPTINSTPHIYVPSSLDNLGQVLHKSENRNELKISSNGDLDYYPTASTSNENDFDYIPTEKVSNSSKNLPSRICYGNIDLTDEFKIIDEILRDENKYEGSKKDSEKNCTSIKSETRNKYFSDSDDKTNKNESKINSDSENQRSKKRSKTDNDELCEIKKVKIEHEHSHKSKQHDDKEQKSLKDNNNALYKHKQKKCDCEDKKLEEKSNSENKMLIQNDDDKYDSKVDLNNEINRQKKYVKEHRNSHKNHLSKRDLKKDNDTKKQASKFDNEKIEAKIHHNTNKDKKLSHQIDSDKKQKSDNSVSTKKYESKNDSSKKHHSKGSISIKHSHKKETNNHRSQSNENCDVKKHSSKEKSHSKHSHRSDNDRKHKSESHKKSDSKSETDKSKQKTESEKSRNNVIKLESGERQHSKTLEIFNYKSKYKKSKQREKLSLLSKSNTDHDKNVQHNNHSFKELKSGSANKEIEYQEASPILDFNDDLSDMDEVERECYEIFNSNEQNYDKQTSPKLIPHIKDETETFTALSKKRVSHINKDDPSILNRRSNIAKPPKLHTMMASRFLIAKEQYEASTSVDSKSSSKDSIPKLQIHTPATSSGKKRIAHVPNVNLLLSAKNKVTNLRTNKTLTSPSAISTDKIVTDRYANKENPANRPVVIDPLSQKIPMITRMTVLNNMIDACLYNNLNVTESYEKARNEEFAVFEKCQSALVYKKSAALAVHRLKVVKNEVSIGTQNLNLSTISISINKNTLKGPALYEYLMKWVLTEQQLRDNCFPRLHPTIKGNGAAIIYNHPAQEKLHEEDERICPRCHRHYFVDAVGFPRFEEECMYHPQRKYTYRGESKYGCCGGDNSIIGCVSAPLHVVDYVDYDNLRGFVHTMPPDNENNNFFGIYALDCEMTYTTAGMELSRVTVVDVDCNVVYEKLVVPDHPIIDYNTRFSGLTEEIMKNAKTTLLEVQATLLHLFNSKTILIGHSLESDFKTLKLIHDVVIDTSILFPHRLGPPMKRGLKNLASDYLRKIIQNSISGHDSAEDAVTCMELVIFKLKEHLKTA